MNTRVASFGSAGVGVGIGVGVGVGIDVGVGVGIDVGVGSGIAVGTLAGFLPSGASRGPLLSLDASIGVSESFGKTGNANNATTPANSTKNVIIRDRFFTVRFPYPLRSILGPPCLMES